MTAMLSGPTAMARAVAGGSPAYLRRASYLPLAGETFRIGEHALQLGVVDDLAGAAADTALRGHPEAFALTFYGPPNAFGAAIQTFTHPQLGTYSLFISPVGAVEGQMQRYEVVVDRSVGRPADPPAPSPDRIPLPERPGTPEGAAAALAEFEHQVAAESRRLERRVAKRRRIKRRKLQRRRAAQRSAASRGAVAKRHAAVKRAAKRSGYTAVKRGAATLIG